MSAPPAQVVRPAITGHWLGWAIYLGMSWTWCIGMFLPVLIMSEYGVTGWWVFAIPNVLGAAAMGWTLRDAQTSFAVAEAHRPATGCFSLVTIAFHGLFIIWIVLQILGGWALILTPVLIIAFLLLIEGAEINARQLAIAALVVSVVTLAVGLYAQEFPYFYGVESLRSGSDTAALAGVCVFGFTLCPYLDRTFHHARQRLTASDGRVAFTVGFLFFFLIMIVLTLCYSGWMNRLLAGSGGFPGLAWTLVGLHLLVQSCFTIAAHAAVVREYGRPAAAAAFVYGALTLAMPAYLSFRVSSSGEFVYRVFMAFYGLVAPAYVWLCMIPGRGRVRASGRQWLVFAVAVSVASPMFWMAFIEGRMAWVGPALAMVLLARLAVPKLTDRATFQPEARQYGEGAAL